MLSEPGQIPLLDGTKYNFSTYLLSVHSCTCVHALCIAENNAVVTVKGPVYQAKCNYVQAMGARKIHLECIVHSLNHTPIQ